MRKRNLSVSISLLTISVLIAGTVFTQENSQKLVSDSKDKDNVSYLAWQYLAWSAYPKAVSVLTEALAVSPQGMEDLYFIRAKAYEVQGNIASAIVDYEYYLKALKTSLSACQGRERQQCLAENLNKIVDVYYRLFLLYMVKDEKPALGLLSEYKVFLTAQEKAIPEKDRPKKLAKYAESLKSLIAFLPELEKRMKESDPSRLKTEIQNVVFGEIQSIGQSLKQQNETLSILNLIRIGAASRKAFLSRKNYPGSLNAYFTDKDLARILDARLSSSERFPRINGYEYQYTSDGQHFTCIAQPVMPVQTGDRVFMLNDQYKIYEDTNGNNGIDSADKIVVDLTS